MLNRLNFNFDTSKFGDAVNLSDSTKEFLSENPIPLKSWQKNELANGSITQTNYFRNPLSQSLQIYKQKAIELSNLIISIDTFDTLSLAISANLESFSTNLQNEITAFTYHTNNVSGVNIIDTSGNSRDLSGNNLLYSLMNNLTNLLYQPLRDNNSAQNISDPELQEIYQSIIDNSSSLQNFSIDTGFDLLISCWATCRK